MKKLLFPYKIKAFLDNKRNLIWRVEAFGRVDLNPEVPSEPTIEVTLVPLRELQINPLTINTIGAYYYKESRVVRVGIGLLPYLLIGSLWQNGDNIDFPDYNLETFDQLLITPETSRLTDASREPDLFTEIFFPAREECLKTKYLVVDLDPQKHSIKTGKQKLLIPCGEIGRVYFFKSTSLARSIIGGDLESHGGGIYNPHRTRLPGADGIGFIQLRQKVTNPQRHVAARIAFDRIANRNARNIHDSIIKNDSNENCAVLEARPPFEGLTNLKLSGKWIMAADDVFHFIAYRIMSCSSPFPYDQLNWARDNEEGNKGTSDLNLPVAFAGSIKKPVRLPETAEDKRLVTNETEPSLDYEVTDFEFDDDCFPDLKEKNKRDVHFKDAERYTRAGKFRNNDAEAVDTLSTGAGEHPNNGVAPLSVSSNDAEQEPDEAERKERVPAGFDEFNAILRELEKLGNIATSVVRLDTSDERSTVKSCTYFPIKAGRKTLKWSYINYDERQRRQAMIAHITYGNSHFYIMDIEVIEDKPNDRYSMLLVHDIKFTEVGEGQLRAVLHFAAENGGRWAREWQLKNLTKKRYKHDCEDTATYANRFFKDIRAFDGEVSTISPVVIPATNEPNFVYEDEISESIIDQQKVV